MHPGEQSDVSALIDQLANGQVELLLDLQAAVAAARRSSAELQSAAGAPVAGTATAGSPRGASGRGRFTGGAVAVDVKGAYDELGSRTGKRKKTIEVSAAAAGGGLAFVLAGGLLSGLWFRRIP